MYKPFSKVKVPVGIFILLLALVKWYAAGTASTTLSSQLGTSSQGARCRPTAAAAVFFYTLVRLAVGKLLKLVGREAKSRPHVFHRSLA